MAPKALEESASIWLLKAARVVRAAEEAILVAVEGSDLGCGCA